MCLYLPEKELMFTGDHILFDITPNITHLLNMDNSLKEYRNSLEKVSKYSVKKAFPAHRTQQKPFDVRIDELKKHHDNRLNEAYNIIKDNKNISAYEVASKFTWSMRGKKFEEFSPSQKWFAVGETIAHLDYLLYEMKVNRTKVDGTFKYY